MLGRIPFEGPRKGYPRLPRKLAYIAQLSRPYTLFAAGLAGFVMGLYYGGLLTAVLLTLYFASVQAIGQVVNQIADIDIDRINKPYRPLPSGKLSVREAWAVAAGYYALGLAVSWLLGSTALVLFGIAVFLAVFYSLEPIRAKKRAWPALAWQAVARGLLPPLSVYLIISRDPALVYLGILAMVWVLALQATKDFGDVEGDRAYGVTTLPIIYGSSGALRIMGYMVAVYIALAGLLWLLAGTTPLYMLIGLLGAWGLRKVDSVTVTENNVAWTVYYAGLGLHYIVFLTQAVL